MFGDDTTPIILINLTKYAKRMGKTRQAIHYQIAKGICAVSPIAGSKPPKWRLDDVEEYERRVEIGSDA